MENRIAGNTLFLYLRMAVSIAVNLVTVRLLWDTLGVNDYGIYNVVGGIVMLFSFLNSAMVASSQRYISYALGLGDAHRLRLTFSVSVTVHAILAAIVLLLAETVGLHFLNNGMNIPSDRMVAANWVYQCSVIAFLINVISVPYNACIVAHEHMKVFGWLGMLDVILKLLIVIIIAVLPSDRLITYAILVALVSVCMRLIYGAYCRRHFAECHYRSHRDYNIIREMFAFAGWSFLGNMGFSVRDYGTNIILNLFFNVSVNAAKGMASQIANVFNSFAANFTMAVNPQLTKRYAAGNLQSMLHLLFAGCKYALLLMAMAVIPAAIATKPLLHYFLQNIAPFTEGFLRLALVISMIDCIVSPITTCIQASGRIKLFQILICLIMVANLPLSWLWLSLDANPYVVMVIAIATSAIALTTRIILLHNIVKFSYRRFLAAVYLRSIPAILLSAALAAGFYMLLNITLTTLIIFILVSVCISALSFYFIALRRDERHDLLNLLLKSPLAARFAALIHKSKS